MSGQPAVRGPARWVVILALLALAPFACSQRSDVQGGAAELRFVTWKPDQPAVWDEAIRKFERESGIRVRREVGPHSSTAFHDLLTQKLKNASPDVDVFFMDVVWVAEFGAAGWAAPLDDHFPETEREAFLPGAVAANTWGGRVYGVPAFVDAGMLYYRKDLLEKHGIELPATWPELAAAAERIVAAERGSTPGLVGYSGQFKQYEGLVCDALEIVVSNGGRLVDERGHRSALLEPRTLDAVWWIRDRLIGAIGPRSLLTYQEAESLALFLQGDAVFHRNWPYAWNVSNDPAHSRVAGRVGVAPLPKFEGGRSVAALGGWQYGVSTFSARHEAAVQFIRFMTSEATQRHFAVEASLAPTRSTLYDDPEVRRRSPGLAEQADAFRLAVPRPVTPMYPAISHALQRFLSAAIVDRKSDVRSLATAASSEIDRLLTLERRTSVAGREP